MRQTWDRLLFAHWPVHFDALRPLVPAALELDRYNGEAWLGVVPFLMRNVRPRALPAVPWLSAFPELNVRTYVTVGGKAGVYFFSLDAGNPLAVEIARRWFHLPYFRARFSVSQAGETTTYRSMRTHSGAPPAELDLTYRPTGPDLRLGSGVTRRLPDRALLPLHDRRARTAAAGRDPSPAVAFAASRGRVPA